MLASSSEDVLVVPAKQRQVRLLRRVLGKRDNCAVKRILRAPILIVLSKSGANFEAVLRCHGRISGRESAGTQSFDDGLTVGRAFS